ncbi:MAG: gliding motility protein RemB, partial [Flavobacteriales bacterium]
HFEIAEDNDRRYVNTRGIEVKGRVGEKLSFYSSFYENQMVLPDYLQDYAKGHNYVVPGQGIVKYYPFLNEGIMDFYYATGYINYDINRFFDVQLGHGKHFIGDGYRSMMLSDNSFNYPYLKITTDVWKFKYVNLFSYFQDINFDIDAPDISKSKFSAIHYLSTNIGERLNIGIFESIMLGEDSLGNVFDINYMNPIIFYRPVEYSIGYSRQGNALLGLSLKYKITSTSHLYGQVVLDEFAISDFRAQNGAWRNKYGGQVGMKYFDAFGFENLTLQSELNFARPFTYS